SISAGPPGGRALAAAARPTAIRRLAPTLSPRTPLASPLVWIITSRPTRLPALRWPIQPIRCFGPIILGFATGTGGWQQPSNREHDADVTRCPLLTRSGHSTACRSPSRQIEPARRRVAGSHFGSLSARIPSL